MIDISLNEVETLAAKAARGIGFAWGLTEDIGRAARKLAQAGAPWPEAVLSLKADWAVPAPSLNHSAIVLNAVPATKAKPLCPIRTAAWLMDSDAVSSIDSLRIDDLALPIWLAGLSSLGNYRSPLRLIWTDAEALILDGSLTLAGTRILAEHAEVSVNPAEAIAIRPTPKTRAFVSAAELKALEALAARTYVPASAASRSKGAGGSRTDDE